MKLRFAFALAATMSVAAPMGQAFAATAYDARTLGMGNSSIGFSGNASLAYWNPAAVGNGTKFGMFLPSLSVSFSNNVLSPADAMSLVNSFQNLGKAGATPSAGGSDIFTNLGGANGLNLQADSIIEPLGMSLGKVGPGNMALRVYGHGTAFAQAKMTQEFSSNLNGLFVQGGFTEITKTIQSISAAASDPNNSNQDQLKADVDKLGTQLNTYMSAFIKTDPAKYSAKTLDLTSVTSANAAVAATYAQPIPLKIAAFPEGQLTVGATAKLFAAPQMSFMAPISLPGAPNSSLSPVGGGVGANINLNIDKEVTELSQSIGKFQKDQNLATTSDLMAKTGAFFSNGLANSNIAFSSVTPDQVGAGLDFGASYRFNKQFSLGLALTNPIMLWGATKNTYTYNFKGDDIKVDTATARTTFSQAEPFVARLGGAWQPEFAGPPILSQGLMVSAGVDAPLNIPVPASASLGVEKLFGPLALRVGTQQGGLAPLYTVGLGVQTSAFQLNLGVGADNPSTKAKAASVALSLGAGF